MSKTRSTLASVTMLLLMVATFTAGQSLITESQARIELATVHAARNEALEQGDLERVKTFYAPNFLIRTHGKTLTLKDTEHVSSIAKKSTVLDRKYTSTIQQLKVRNQDVVLVVEQNALERQQGKDGSLREHRQTLRQQETWVKHGDEWKLTLIEDIKVKHSETRVNGQKVQDFIPEAEPVTLNATDEPRLTVGNGMVFVYRLKDFGIIKAPVYCNDQKLAQLTGGSFVKLNLPPGRYLFRSDKGGPIEIAVEAGKIQFLELKLEPGFPKGRGRLKVDKTVMGPQGYKAPRLLELNPLGDDNIYDRTKVITNNP